MLHLAKCLWRLCINYRFDFKNSTELYNFWDIFTQFVLLHQEILEDKSFYKFFLHSFATAAGKITGGKKFALSVYLKSNLWAYFSTNFQNFF